MPGKYGKYSAILESNTYEDVSPARSPGGAYHSQESGWESEVALEMEIVFSE